MAKTPEAALDLLNSVWPRGAGQGASRSDALQALIQAEGGNFALAPWDWRYYAEKRRKAEFDFDEGAIKPYLQLDRMIEAAFYTAGRLFGAVFKPRDRRAGLSSGRPRLGSDRRGGDAMSASSSATISRRTSKRSGAWMSQFPQPGEARRRHPPDRRQRDEFLQGRRRRADAAQLRRRAHALPRVRPRACMGSSPM